MPTITFKAKPTVVYGSDDRPAYSFIKVPKLARRHCDMAAFRTHPRFRSYANSDLFPGMLARAVANAGVKSTLRLDTLPPAVTVDTSGFLATVTINLD